MRMKRDIQRRTEKQTEKQRRKPLCMLFISLFVHALSLSLPFSQQNVQTKFPNEFVPTESYQS